MGSRCVGLAAPLVVLSLCACNAKPHAVVCRVTYGGEERRLEFPATSSPYTVEAATIAGRFAFKAVYLREPWLSASISVYAYQRTPAGDRLLQEAVYAPPFSLGAGARYGFTGRQLVYSYDQRELEYWCEPPQ